MIEKARDHIRDAFGKATMAMMAMPRYRHQTLADLNHLVLDPLIRDRLAIAYPQLIALEDITDPTSIFEVDPDNIAAVFGSGYALERITVIATDKPITTGVIGLSCTNPARDSRPESSMIAGRHEQLGRYEVQDQELAFVQHSAEATRIAVDLV